MGLINRRTRVRIGGLRVVIRPIEANFGIYKRYGCLVIVRATKRRRRRAGVDVNIKNYYFGSFPSPVTGVGDHPRFLNEEEIRSRNARRTSLSKFTINLGTHSDFPIKGVISIVRITINGEQETFRFNKGAIDPNFTAPGII